MNVSQTDFYTALRAPDKPLPSELKDAKGQTAGRRFNVYRNNVATSLMDALESGFPVIARLLGEQNFRNIARDFQWNAPPSSPLMMHYGNGFPEYLDEHPALARFPYLGDVARLELALRHAYHAADSTAIDPSLLQHPDLINARFGFAPSVQLISSRWPILSVWRFNTQGGSAKPQAQAEHVLITRPDYDPIPENISKGDAALIRSLMADESLSEALTAAQGAEPEHDFSRILGRLLAGHAITHIRIKADLT